MPFPAFATLRRGRDRVPASAAERLASQKSPTCQSQPAEKTVGPKSLHRIVRTRWLKPATQWQPRRNSPLIEPDEKYCDRYGKTTSFSGKNPCFFSRSANSPVTSMREAFFMRLRGITKSRQGAMRGFSNRMLSQTSRLARFRSTESRLYFLLHITAHRSFSAGAVTTSMRQPASRTPSDLMLSN